MPDKIIQQPVGARGSRIIEVTTRGETLADGTSINVLRLSNGSLGVIRWFGTRGEMDSAIVHEGYRYKPAPIEESVLRELTLPTEIIHCRSTREFWTVICDLIRNFVGLEGQAVELVARTILCSALLEALPVAPALEIVGPDYARGKRLLDFLKCTCRNSLRLTAVTASGLHSLGATGAQFTYLIRQAVIDDALKKLLSAAGIRDQKIPFRGRLLDLFGVQVIQSDFPLAANSAPLRSIQVSMLPTNYPLPPFDLETQRKITNEIQGKLLMFRCVKLEAARNLIFDASRFAVELQDLASSLARATPDDVELQSRVFDALHEEDAEVRSYRWTDLNRVACDAILLAHSRAPGNNIYIADLASIAEEILQERGAGNVVVAAATFGKRLSHLGFRATRDSKGRKLLLTEDAVNRAEDLLHRFIGATAA